MKEKVTVIKVSNTRGNEIFHLTSMANKATIIKILNSRGNKIIFPLSLMAGVRLIPNPRAMYWK